MYKINPILVSTTKKTNQFHSSQQQEFIGQKAYAFLHSYQIHFNVDFQIEMKDEILFFQIPLYFFFIANVKGERYYRQIQDYLSCWKR